MPAITPLPTPAPTRTDPATFSARADSLVAALPTMVTEMNATAEAMNLNDTSSTSTASLLISVASKSLTVAAAKSYLPGMSVKIARTSSPSNWMHGDVTSYNSTTGALVVNVTSILGSGTYTDWTVTFSAPVAVPLPGSITRAMITNVTATQRVIGRNTAGAGVEEEVTLTQLLDWIGSAAQGDTFYRGASSWARRAAGAEGQYFKTNGAGADPSWSDFPIATAPEAVEGTASTLISALRLRDALNASGSAPVYAVRSWISFDASSGAPVISGSGNASLTDNGAGLFTYNFTTALPDDNYAVIGMVKKADSSATNGYHFEVYGKTTAGFSVKTSKFDTFVAEDCAINDIFVIR